MVSEINGRGISAPPALDQRTTKVDGTAATDAAIGARGKGADVVTLTDLASRLQQLTQSVADIPVADREKVEQFRQAVADGGYEVDSRAVADKLTQIESMLAGLSDE